MAKRRPPDDDDEDDEEEEEAPPKKRRSRKQAEDDGLPRGTPRQYVHLSCGEVTTMPTDVIETYLDNPFHFAPMTYCAECEKDVPNKKCEWEETGENLNDYFEDLQARKLLSGEDPRRDKIIPYLIPVITVIAGGVMGYFAAVKFEQKPVVGVIGGVLLVGLIVGIRTYFHRRNYLQIKEEYDRKLFKRFYERHPDERPQKKRKKRVVEDDEDE
ncbi:MAG: hypothetical protein ACRCZF_00675 [Gemmataceae bacterium]